MKITLLGIALVLAFLSGWVASRVYFLWDYIDWYGGHNG